jgi:hypothetical protein
MDAASSSLLADPSPIAMRPVLGATLVYVADAPAIPEGMASVAFAVARLPSPGHSLRNPSAIPIADRVDAVPPETVTEPGL